MSAKTICYTDRWKNSLSVRVTNTNDQTMETNDENQELPKGSICSASVDLIHDAEHAISSYIALAPNVILSITAILGNILILLALPRASSLHAPSKLLFRCLATTDVSVGLISQPLFMIHVFSVINKRGKLCFITERSAYITSAALCGVSVLTLSAVSVDRLLALTLRMRYRELVTVKRVRVVIVFIWLVSSANALLYLWDSFFYLIGCCIVILTAVCIATFCYTTIYVKLRHQKLQIQDHLDPGRRDVAGKFNINKYKKTVYSALWVHLTLVACSVPFVIVTAAKTIHGINPSLFVAEAFAATLVYLNSSLNPILYCWKIKEVREAVKETLKQCRH